MNNIIKLILCFTFLIYSSCVFAQNTKDTNVDFCKKYLYDIATKTFQKEDICVLEGSNRVILRFEIENFELQNKCLDKKNLKKLRSIEYFLAKIKNFAIIEVHTQKLSLKENSEYKNWEIATVIANMLEDELTKPKGIVAQNRIHSVGYGEFFPTKNTPNNGCNYLNRVDIILLCNIGGE